MERIDKQEEESQQSHSSTPSNSNNRRNIFALLLIFAGAYWLLNRAGIVNFPHWLFQWPVILIGLGVFNLITHRFQSIGGWVLLLLGGYFYVDRNFDIPFNLAYYFWPIAMITLGLILLLRPKHNHRNDGWNRQKRQDGTTFFDAQKGTDASDVIDEQVVFGSIDKSFTSKQFKGGKISCAMGGADIYFGDCEIQQQATLQVNGFMGGVSITVPRTWYVQVKANALLGAINDDRKNVPTDIQSAPTLVITGGVFMAGLEIKSV